MTNISAVENMVKQQLLTNRIEDPTLIDCFYTLPREAFFSEELAHLAYCDTRLSLPNGEESLTPLEEATIVQALNLKGTETVLEIGTGSGYLTALLARFSKEVVTIEQDENLTSNAKKCFAKFGLENILALTGDGSRGWMDKGPYDVIVITGGLKEIGKHFKPQLMKGGTLFAFVGEQPCFKAMLMTLDNKEQWQAHSLFDTDVALLKTQNHDDDFIF